MNITPDDFRDKGVKSFITNQSTDGDNPAVDVRELQDFLVELAALFEEVQDGGKSIGAWLSEDIQFFSSATRGDDIYNSLEGLGYKGKMFQLKKGESSLSWERVTKSLREEYRYYIPGIEEDTLRSVLSTMSDTLPSETILYRARLIPPGRSKFQSKRMGMPPAEHAGAGRANPAGIPYLYLCLDDETPLYEVRPNKGDLITLGTFQVEDKEGLNLVDFAAAPSMYQCRYDCHLDVSKVYAFLSFFADVREHMSRPKGTLENDLAYLPTQMICEYCKRFGYDGVSFPSSLHGGGTNVVLFSEQKVSCTTTVKKGITELSISSW